MERRGEHDASVTRAIDIHTRVWKYKQSREARAHTHALLVIVEEHGALVLRLLARRGVVILPKHVEQLTVRDLVWVVLDLDGLRVIAQIVVRRVELGAARVADASAHNTRKRSANMQRGQGEERVCVCGVEEGRGVSTKSKVRMEQGCICDAACTISARKEQSKEQRQRGSFRQGDL